MTKKGLLLVNSYYQGDDITLMIKRFAAEFKRLGIIAEARNTASITAYLDNNKYVLAEFPYDFAVVLDKDKYLPRILEQAGIRVFNKETAKSICDDKMLSYLTVGAAGIKIPKTIAGLLGYQRQAPNGRMLDKVERLLGYPLIIKESYGSLGRQVYLVNNRTELLEKAEAVITKPHLFQEYISSSHGKDIRVIVINKQAVAWMLRQSTGDFRSNLSEGGMATNIDLSPAYKEMAERVAEIIDLDYCGVDILIGSLKEPLFCEVNSTAFFTGIEKTSGVNVAGLYCQYIYESVYSSLK